MRPNAALIALSVALGACGSHDAPAIGKKEIMISHAKAAYARGEQLGAKDAADTTPKPGGGAPYPGAWTPTVPYRDSVFAIERPASSKVEIRPQTATRGREVLITQLPDCKWSCFVSISVWPDSSGGGAHAMVRALTSTDTRHAALTPEGEAKIIDSLPLGADAAVHLEMSCGDCAMRAIVTSSRGWIARIEYSADDREGYSPALSAHLDAIARSFRWRH